MSTSTIPNVREIDSAGHFCVVRYSTKTATKPLNLGVVNQVMVLSCVMFRRIPKILFSASDTPLCKGTMRFKGCSLSQKVENSMVIFQQHFRISASSLRPQIWRTALGCVLPKAFQAICSSRRPVTSYIPSCLNDGSYQRLIFVDENFFQVTLML